ncbi:MAG TPA: DoxX family protein [Polyangiaceae bacterium]|nr:DoxX family protein [Polyangiaceae bacterium]
MRTLENHETDTDRQPAVLALTLLRIGVGAILVAHGWQKLNDIHGTAAMFAHEGIPNPTLSVYLAIAGEFFGGLGLALGALTHLAALGPLLVMGCAIYFVHRDNGLFAQNGGFEYPLALALVALYFVARGGGPLSVDALVMQRRAPPARRPRRRVEAITHP